MNTPEPTAGRPEPPLELGKLAQDEWDRLMADLEDMGALFRVERAAAYQYVKIFAETEAVAADQASARASLQRIEDGMVELGAEARAALLPDVVALHKSIGGYTDKILRGRLGIRSYLVEFGLTPSARSRVKLPAKKAAVDEFTARQRARPTLERVK